MPFQPFKRTETSLSRRRRLFTTFETSVRMARVRQRGTTPELAVRAAVAALGMRFTLTNPDLPGSPDLANRRRGIAIFVHGCFWHRHPNCAKTTTPKRNAEFWEAKFRRNQARDRVALRTLRRNGYRAVVIWECDTRRRSVLRSRLKGIIRRTRVPASTN